LMTFGRNFVTRAVGEAEKSFNDLATLLLTAHILYNVPVHCTVHMVYNIYGV
jgi:hypothetical protein